MRAFWDLSTERQLGFTVGPIPVSAIQDYASAKGLPSYMMVLFESVIRAMDKVYLESAEKARKKSADDRQTRTQSHMGTGREQTPKT